MVLGLRWASLRRLAGGASSVRTWISATSTLSCAWRGDALPDGGMVELGDGYRLDASMVEVVFADACGGSEGDLERTDRGDEERIEGVALRSERGDDGGDEDESMILAGESIGNAQCREMRASWFPDRGRVFAARVYKEDEVVASTPVWNGTKEPGLPGTCLKRETQRSHPKGYGAFVTL